MVTRCLLWGAHVSACPNHQTGRMTPLETRAVVAMSGTFGYELDLNRLTEAECGEVRAQIERFKRWAGLIGSGAYFRLAPPDGESDFTAWQFTSEDRREALLNLVVTHPRANPRSAHVCLRGLDPNACYRVDELGLCRQKRCGRYPARGAARQHCRKENSAAVS